MAKMTLDELVAQLRVTYGGALDSVVLYGSAAAPGHVAGNSDFNVLVLVSSLSLEQLEGAAAATARAWREAGNPPPMTMTTAEWRRSVDIFPMEYADIFSRHRVLHGVLPVEGITVRPQDLRLQLEHEAMGKLLQLRGGILAAGGDAAQEKALLGRSASAIVALCRALLRLHGEEPPAETDAVVRSAARRAGFDAAPVLAAVEIRKGGKAEGVRAILGGYLGAVEALVQHLDEHETTA